MMPAQRTCGEAMQAGDACTPPPCQNCHRCRFTGAAAGPSPEPLPDPRAEPPWTLAGAAVEISPELPPESCRNHRWNLARTAVEIAATAN
ncbi:hypothetical protein VNO80_06839 [Phaseolus coccineus]|uniref:Uncharacterized protein n=1 Tax=Phaseolus coccineus TaxID=3886 RepID=A0AAN9NMD0_PHACN